MIFISNPVINTWIFSGLLGLALLLSIRKLKDKTLFPISVTQELKGFAILVIVFAHIGYALSSDDKFLWPLSNLAGVGVNIFLFTSGYGLTISSLMHKFSLKRYYFRRLKKLYLPFWLMLGLYLLLDYYLLHRTYPAEYIFKAFAGIFETADTNNDINSPLWYFTLIAFYYLIYPIFFIKKCPWLSAILIFIFTYVLLYYSSIGSIDNAQFYKVYTVAFPLGMVAAWLYSYKQKIRPVISNIVIKINKLVNSKPIICDFHCSKVLKTTLYVISLLGFLGLIIYSRAYSGPWDSLQKEQTVNVLTMLALVIFFIIKRVNIKILYLFGVYSYEIYLLHWPLMSRYDIFFKYIPGWMAVIFYLIIFLALGWMLSKFSVFYHKLIIKSQKIVSRSVSAR